jgi:deoxyribonuclease IV
LEQFDKTIGLGRLAVVHLNDSKNFRGAGKDRHAPLGAGMIGFDAMNYIVHHEKIRHLPLVLETPWIGKEKGKERPMYKAEIAVLQGDVEKRLGENFLDHVDHLEFFFRKKEIDPRDFVVQTWQTLKTDAKAKKEDGREPIERLFDLVKEERLFPDLSEEEINHRLIAWFAGKQVL